MKEVQSIITDWMKEKSTQEFCAIDRLKELNNVCIDPTRCMECALCHSHCPTDSIELHPKESISLTKALW